MKISALTVLLLIMAGLALPMLTFANIRLPSVLADNMVLQRNADVKLWGWV